MSAHAEVVLLGDLNIDLNLEIPEYPAPGGDGVATAQDFGFGGSAANTAVMLSRLGVGAALFACVGDDAWGSQAIRDLAAEGVDTRFVQRRSGEPTSLNVVAVTPDGERTMFAYRGASTALRADDLERALAAARHLHISGYAFLEDPQCETAFAAARCAAASGATISIDVPVDPVHAVPDLLREAFGLADAVIAGAQDARRLTGEADDVSAADAIAALGPSIVALTRGATGSLLRTSIGFTAAPVPAVRAVDTTGAGDSYCAGLIAALMRRSETPMLSAMLANVCGAAAVGVRGAGARLPQRESILQVAAVVPDGLDRELRSLIAREERSC